MCIENLLTLEVTGVNLVAGKVSTSYWKQKWIVRNSFAIQAHRYIWPTLWFDFF